MADLTTLILVVHVAAGGIGLLSGAAALIFRKGARLHRSAGKLFVGAMLVMAATAGYLGVNGPFGIAASLSGALVFYLVVTAWLTVRRKQIGVGVAEFAGLVLGVGVLSAYVVLALQTPQAWLAGPLIGVAIAAFGVGLDVFVIVRGGVSGAGRIARHVWRMCLPLWQASSFFFLAQPDLFSGVPLPVLATAPLVVVALMIFWLLRVQFTQQFKTAH